MKKFNKIIALILSLILIGSATSAIALATDLDNTGDEEAIVLDDNEEDAEEEYSITVTSWKQLKFALIIKIIDKIFKFFQDLINGDKSFDDIKIDF